MTSSLASRSPFATADAAVTAAPLGSAARLFTPAPFAPCTEPFAPLRPEVAEFPSTPTARLLQLGLGLTAAEVDELLRRAPVSTDCYAPTTLHRRDRSVYAWFETVGITLTLAAVSIACAALLIG